MLTICAQRTLSYKMHIDLSTLDLDLLKKLYTREAYDLHAALLDGASWQEVEDHRKIVTALGTELHKRLHAGQRFSFDEVRLPPLKKQIKPFE